MALTIHAEGGRRALFRSARTISFSFGRSSAAAPLGLARPDAVAHGELGEGRFFTLDITHKRFGRLICQSAAFEEANDDPHRSGP